MNSIRERLRQSHMGRQLAEIAMLTLVSALFAYGASDCVEVAGKTKAVDHLTVVPTDSRGKLEYCAFATRATRKMTRVPTGGPVDDLCGQSMEEVVERADAYELKINAQVSGCYLRYTRLQADLGLSRVLSRQE